MDSVCGSCWGKNRTDVKIINLHYVMPMLPDMEGMICTQ